MTRKKLINRIISAFLAVTIVISVFFSMNVFSFAASYTSISLDVPRISQRPGVGDCAIASIASVEAYAYKLPTGDYNSTAYKAVYSANGNSYSAMWSTLGYTTYESFDMQVLYNQLNSGYPVIVHRTSNHYSVVYGYSGSTTTLQLSGFLIFDVDDSYTNSTANKTLDKWKGSYSLDRMVLRRNGLAITNQSLIINGNHPYPSITKGNTFSVLGTVASKYNITSVTMKITDSSGAVAQNSSYSATPNSKSFTLSNGDNNMNFSKLGAGNYKYLVTAKDSSGDTKTYSYSFKVVSNSSDSPNGSTDDNTNDTFVSYAGVVTADPSLNIRSGTSTSYSVIGSVPYKAAIIVTSESSGWGKTTYNGVTGWVSLQYVKKSTESGMYARITANTSSKTSPSNNATTVINLPKNTIVPVSEQGSDWFKVSYSGKAGWISSDTCIYGVGDVNSSSSVNSADALIILKHSVGINSMTQVQKNQADMNGDGEVNSADALIILKISVGAYNQ